MNPIKLYQIENRLVRQSLVLLALAVVYGTAAGAVVTMYYEVVPNMGAIEDRLGSVQAVLYVLAVGSGLIHLPRALQQLKNKSWRQAIIQAGLVLGPAFIFVGSDGLVSHLLWWGPISDTDRYHILHHSLFGGVSLTLLYGLALRRWWAPTSASDGPVSRIFLVIGAAFAIIFSMAIGILFGAPSAGLILIAGLLASVVYARFAREKVKQ
jgi:hypothetical protein